MKVLYCIPGLAINLDAPWVTRSRARGMIAAGLEVVLLLPSETYRAYFRDMPCEIIIEHGASDEYRHHVTRGTLFDFILKPALTQWRAIRIAREIGADVLYFFHCEPWTLLPTVILRRGWRRSRVLLSMFVTHLYYHPKISRQCSWVSQVRGWLNFTATRCLARMVCVVYGDPFMPAFFGEGDISACAIVEEGYREDLAATCRREDSRVRLGIPLDRRVLLSFGVASVTKGQDLLFDAMRGLDPECDVYVVGATGGVYLDPRVTGRDLLAGPWKDRLHFVSRYVSDEEMLDYFSAADAIVLPYRYGFVCTSGSFRMAVECGRAVIVSDQYYLGATVRQRGLGLLFPPEDVPALRAAIREFSHKPRSWFDDISAQCARIAHEQSWTVTGQKYKAIFANNSASGMGKAKQP